MKVLANDNDEAIYLSETLERIMLRIEESNLHDTEKTSFVIFLSKIRGGEAYFRPLGPGKKDGLSRVPKTGYTSLKRRALYAPLKLTGF